MSIKHHSEHQFPPNNIVHISLRHPNPPILESMYYLPIKLLILVKGILLDAYRRSQRLLEMR